MNKKKRALVAALVVSGIAVVGLAAVVYAKYISSITKTGTATVAKWAFTTNNTTGNITCELDETYDPDTLVSGKIAPGTSGKCPIQISNVGTEVGIEYKIELPSTVANKPTNLTFYQDDAHQTPMTSAAPITGTLEPNEAATTIYVYWEWPYQDGTTTYDTADTTDGVSASTLTLTFTVTGTQLEPVAQ